MSAKKKTSKKKLSVVPASISQPPTSKRRSKYAFDVLAEDNEDLIALTGDSLARLNARRKGHVTGFYTLREIQRTMVPYRHFYFQYAMSAYGIPERCLLEIIGAEHLGKSTLAMWMAGGAMEQGVPCAVQETEEKELMVSWAARALSTNKKKALTMLKRIGFFKTRQLEEMDSCLEDWLNVVRGKAVGATVAVPLQTPVMMIVDTLSKLLPESEAMGFYDYGKNMTPENKKKSKATGKASNLVFSKFMQAFGRKLPNYLGEYNSIIIFLSHQNDDIDMSGAGAFSFLSADQKNLYNKKKIGGRATNQNSAVQLILAKSQKVIKNSGGEKIGHTVKMRVAKNSYGPQERVIEYDILYGDHDDTEDTLSPSISFDRAMAVFFAEKKILGVKINKDLVTCPPLGLKDVTYEEFSREFHAREDIVSDLGKSLKIHGFLDEIDEIQAEEEVPAAPTKKSRAKKVEEQPEQEDDDAAEHDVQSEDEYGGDEAEDDGGREECD